MDYRFKADEWRLLSNEERVRRCRMMAEQSQMLAEQGPHELKERFLFLSGEWRKLAAELERFGT